MSSIKITLPLAFVMRQSPPPARPAITSSLPAEGTAPTPAEHPVKGILDTAGRLLGGLITTLAAQAEAHRDATIDRGLLGEVCLTASMDPPGRDANGVFRAGLSLGLGVHLMAAWSAGRAPAQAEAQAERVPASNQALVQAT